MSYIYHVNACIAFNWFILRPSIEHIKVVYAWELDVGNATSCFLCNVSHEVCTQHDPLRYEIRLRQTGSRTIMQFRLRQAALALANGKETWKSRTTSIQYHYICHSNYPLETSAIP